MSVNYITAHGNATSLTHWVRVGIEPAPSWILLGFVSVVPQREFLLKDFKLQIQLFWYVRDYLNFLFPFASVLISFLKKNLPFGISLEVQWVKDLVLSLQQLGLLLWCGFDQIKNFTFFFFFLGCTCGLRKFPG